MTAEIVSVGTELLMGQIVDTDAAHLAGVLPEYGVACLRRQTIGDNLSRLTEALKVALDRSDIVFTIGGLGPTEDDLTREAIAAAIGQELVLDERVGERLRKFFASRNLSWLDRQLNQAMRPADASVIENPNGTAPGLICPAGKKYVVALPGPKGEFVPMVEGPIRAWLGSLGTGRVIRSRVVKSCGLGESIVEERVRELIHAENPTVAPYAHPGEVHLRLTASGVTAEDAEALLDPLEKQVQAILGDAVFGGASDTLESVILAQLRIRGEKLAVAESCTGGGLGARITSVAGSSDVFLGGAISYANEVKKAVLGVRAETLNVEGAVSEACAREMAEGACRAFGADWGVSITGVAGPDGGTPQKPVGLVFIGVSGPDGTTVEEHRFRGSRDGIRQRSVQFALIQLWNRLRAKPE